MIINLIVMLVIVGLVWWLIESFLPIDYRIKQVIYVLMGIFVVVAILAAFGVNVPFFSKLLT